MTMADPKPIASLSGMLLARKGDARPAMRRPSMNGLTAANAAAVQDDLGWNDMGYDVDPSPNAPMDYDHDAGYNPLAGAVPDVKPEVRLQQERIAEQLQVQAEVMAAPPLQIFSHTAEPVQEIAPPAAQAPQEVQANVANKKRALPGSKGKAAFTLRLDTERHLQLRLACAVSNRSAQMLVTQALDTLLQSMPEIGQLASRVPQNSHNTSTEVKP